MGDVAWGEWVITTLLSEKVYLAFNRSIHKKAKFRVF